MDTENFMKQYMRLLAQRVSPYMPAQEFVHKLLAATHKMVINNDPLKTNREVFNEEFFGSTGLRKEELSPVFEDFYSRDFPSLAQYTKPNAVARQVLAKAQSKGLTLVVATNPVFPMTAIRERLRWAGVDDFGFRLVTSYEEMHFCKPNPNYYREILDYLKVNPEECLMVGNDAEEDLVAGELKITTFLVEDCLIQRGTMNQRPDYQGSMTDLLRLLETL
ncbi:hypothetical protein SY88_00520 [Clostridiales bacterium PH28_bin88]|nr:hypothetical protein SY88_00520 [Clostridiales bacterium PH28_bin88]